MNLREAAQKVLEAYSWNEPINESMKDLNQALAQPVDKTAKREHEWVGLTDKDKDELVESLPEFYSVEDVIASVAAKLKEKNA